VAESLRFSLLTMQALQGTFLSHLILSLDQQGISVNLQNHEKIHLTFDIRRMLSSLDVAALIHQALIPLLENPRGDASLTERVRALRDLHICTESTSRAVHLNVGS
jgi:hypothetical protein